MFLACHGLLAGVASDAPSDTGSDYLLNTVTKTISRPVKIGIHNASYAEISPFLRRYC